VASTRNIKPDSNEQMNDAKFLEDPFIASETVEIQLSYFTAVHILQRVLFVCSKQILELNSSLIF
jgi:hypothetical protein